MSTGPTATPATLLNSLASVNGYVGIAIQLGETLIPLGKALVKKIEGIGKGNETITYQLLVQSDNAELGAIDNLSDDDLTAINAELERLGQPPLAAPPTPPASS